MGESADGVTRFSRQLGKAGGRNYSLAIFCIAIVFWSLWTTRNKMVIEGVFPRQPTEILYKVKLWLQKWQVFLRRDEKTRLEEMIEKAKSWWKDFIKDRGNKPAQEYFM